ncbi:hypothetical protein MKW92_029924 [Papaver armeniacum]|nr:hypothetical protein MKW92_029924 [Papaver armeniacum]
MLVPAPIFYFKTFWLFAVFFMHQVIGNCERANVLYFKVPFILVIQTQLCCSFTRRFGCRSCGS